jgi:hypothetical protein
MPYGHFKIAVVLLRKRKNAGIVVPAPRLPTIWKRSEAKLSVIRARNHGNDMRCV